MKLKNLFILTIFAFFHTQISGMKFTELPNEITYFISTQGLTIKKVGKLKQVCTYFNEIIKYSQILSENMHAESINLRHYGLIAFAHLYTNESDAITKTKYLDDFTHFLSHAPTESKQALTLLGWNINLSAIEAIDAYRGVSATVKPYWGNILNNDLALKIVYSSVNPNNLKNIHDKTILFAACLHGNTKIVELLLKNRIDPNIQKKGITVLDYAYSLKFNKEITELLIAHGARHGWRYYIPSILLTTGLISFGLASAMHLNDK